MPPHAGGKAALSFLSRLILCAGKIGAPPFAVRQMYQQVARYTERQLRDMAQCCMDTEYQVKSGRMALEGALEKTMLQLLRIRLEGKA